MAKKYLDENGLLYLWQKIKAKFISDVTYNSTSRKIQKTQNGTTSDIVTFGKVATSNSYNDLDNKPTIPSGVEKTTTTPKMDGTAAVGSETKFAAGDHVHPRDTTKADVTNTVTNVSMDNQYRLTQTINGATTTVTGLNVAVVNVLRGYPIDGKTPSDQYWLTSANSGTVVAMTPQFNILYLIMADQDSTGTKENDMFVWGGTQNGFVKVSSVFATSNASTSDPGLMSAEDKTKLAGIAAGAEVNQNAFSSVKVGSSTIAADGKTDTLELVAGSNVTITPDATNDKVTIAATNTKYTAASTTPLMDGTGAVGTSAKYAREDHVHPSDTSRVPTSRTVNGHALSSNISLDAIDVSAIPSSEKGAASGVCPLNASSKIDATYLPSYVDDVIEAYPRSGQTPLSKTWLATGSASGTVITPEAGKIYVLMADSGDYTTNTQFRWSGTTYVKLNDGGVTSIANAEIDTIIAS